jgi:hypothetical protein
MKQLLIAILLIPSLAGAEAIVQYVPATGDYLGCNQIGDPTIWLNDVNDPLSIKSGYIQLPDGTNCDGTHPFYNQPDYKLKVVAGVVVQRSQAEIDSAEAAIVTAYLAARRATAVEVVDAQEPSGIQLRALVLMLLDEINILRASITSIQNVSDAAASYGAHRTAMQALADLNPRTATQVRNAYKNKVNAGDADQ